MRRASQAIRASSEEVRVKTEQVPPTKLMRKLVAASRSAGVLNWGEGVRAETAGGAAIAVATAVGGGSVDEASSCCSRARAAVISWTSNCGSVFCGREKYY